MKRLLMCLASCIFIALSISAQNIDFNKAKLEKGRADMWLKKMDGKTVLKVIMDSTVTLFDEATFIKLQDFTFTDGAIEVNVFSKFLPNAPEWARGFIGVAFRINHDNSKFESIYIRPDNGRTNDQVRRNHTIQYFAYPDFKFDRLRKEEPGKYESYADMQMNRWIKMKIIVKGREAKLYIDDNPQPSLIVNDMKHGATSSGSVGFWVGEGTEGYFKDLKITKTQ
ncbi:MAG: hypothetical protein IT249_15015 [Chitinophagaceae bacterium]|nr:hypothetical protein [Chitinophagaceae bacterium]